MSTTNSNVASLSTAIAPLALSADVGITRGATVGATLTGGANTDGAVIDTQGRVANSAAMRPVNAADCGVANGVDTTATGACANAGTLIGVNGATQTTVANGASAYGAQSLARDVNTTAIGFRATAMGAGSAALGYQALANAPGAVAIGANANASASNSVALGAGSVADQANTVSVGSAGNERRITNVAAGANPTDAANVSQLMSMQNNVTNVYNTLSSDIKHVASVAYSGVAMSMALAADYMPKLDPGQYGVGAGVGTFQGYSALGLNFKSLSESGRWSWGAGIAATAKQIGANAGVGYKW
ncbi:YadA family autotransporter adhesin [Paraburkholderia phymatum]|uniref:YadA family autotransporter adhesin n=1 Tax=Paraburkholderia phymatum TaxID=148447 RepID=A0ACC6TWN5_9BURK